MEQTFLTGRIGRVLEELKKHIMIEKKPADRLWIDKSSPYALYPTGNEIFEECRNGIRWSGRDQHFWMKAEFVIPAEFRGETVIAEIRTAHTDDWNIANPQFKVFQDGRLIHGLDVNHREMQICKQAEEGAGFEYIFSVYSGTEDAPSCISFYYGIKEKMAEQVYYDLWTAFEVLKLLDDTDRRKTILKNILEKAVNILDFRDAGIRGEHFRGSLVLAAEFMKENLYETSLAEMEPLVYGAGHTHIDAAWLWTLAQTREKAARSFSNVLDLMEQYPEYTFFSSQPQLYEYVKEDYPEVYQKIQQRIREGRWEADGAMWLEADCNLTSGESLVRQIMMGKKFFQDEFGKECKFLWLPDAFGYNAALPQILKKSGIEYFVTAKINWNEYNRMPYDVFLWRGIDGSEIFTYFITTIAPKEEIRNFPEGFPMGTYNGILQPDVVLSNYERFQQKPLCDTTLLPFGYGDGGGGTTGEMIEIARRLEKGIPGCPRLEFSSVSGFLEHIEAQIPGKDLPKWWGELYLEYHRGTYTNRGKIKQNNRRAEELLTGTEFFSVLAEVFDGEYQYPKEIIQNNWKKVLRNQFHDILPGTSIKEVYEDSDREYEEVFSSLNETVDGALHASAFALKISKTSLFIVNPTGTEYSNVMETSLPAWCNSIVDPEGNSYPVQRTDKGRALVWAEKLPPFGFRLYTLSGEEYSRENRVSIHGNQIETPYYKLVLNEKGELTELYDKENDRQVLKAGGKGNILQLFEDMPHNFDAWDIPAYYREKQWEAELMVPARVTETGPVRWTVEVVNQFMNSVIRQKIHVCEKIPYIDFETEIDWREEHVLLKTAFEADIHAEEAVYEIQFGNLYRPAHYNTSWDRAKFEVCAHKWADLSEEGYGAALFNDCKYGYDIHEGVMRLTLLRSAADPYEGVDYGKHKFRYAFYPHSGGFREGKVIPYAYAYNQRPAAMILEPQDGREIPEYSLVRCQTEHVVLETVKKSEDGTGIILRLYEAFNKRGNVLLQTGPAIETAKECDLMEERMSDLKHDAHTVEAAIKPYEIKTVFIQIKPDSNSSK